MKKSKSAKPNIVKEPEVEYVKKNSLKKATRHPKKKIAGNKISEEPKLLTNEDPFMLDEIFGIWKNRKFSLEKVREETWGKRGR